MRDWLKEGIDELIAGYKKDIWLIGSKNKDTEWKRDHYRYTSAVVFQRIFNLLESSITETLPAGPQESTRTELIELGKIISRIVKN